MLRALAGVPNIVAVKESAPDPRRFTDLVNTFGDRFEIFAGLDDIALEGLMLGAKGWVSGLTSAFPSRRNPSRWWPQPRGVIGRRPAASIAGSCRCSISTPSTTSSQSIKLAEQIMGRGSERVRMPRLPLSGARRAEVIAMVETAAVTRPTLALAKAA